MNVKLEINFWVQYFLAPELQLFVSSLESVKISRKRASPAQVFNIANLVLATNSKLTRLMEIHKLEN